MNAFARSRAVGRLLSVVVLVGWAIFSFGASRPQDAQAQQGSTTPTTWGPSLMLPQSEPDKQPTLQLERGGAGSRPEVHLPAPVWEIGSQSAKGRDMKLPRTHDGSVSAAGWRTIMYEGFEYGFPWSGWTLLDLSNDGYERLWNDVVYAPYSGESVGWPAGGGADPLDPPNYANNMDSWMIYGPFDLSNATDAQVVFFLWRELEPNYDFIEFYVSDNGQDFTQWGQWGGNADWEQITVGLGDYAGESAVWIAWRFFSDDVVTGRGPLIDEIAIQSLAAAPTVTLDPTSGPAGTTMTAIGSRFTPGVVIDIEWDGQWIDETISDDAGNFTTSFTVPQDATPGSHEVVFNDTSLSGPDVTVYFTVTPPSASVANFDAWPLSGNAPLTVSMHNISSGTYTSCTWDYGDTMTGTSCAAYHDHTYTAAGSYRVRLTVSGPGGSDTMTRNNYINVSAVSTYSISGAVRTTGGVGISGVTVSIPGLSAPTGGNGQYSLCCVTAGNYTVTPSKSGYTFDPPATIVAVIQNVSGIDFVGTTTGGGFDLGFQPYPNGYRFENYQEYTALSLEDLRKMFGDSHVCASVDNVTGTCHPKYPVRLWLAVGIPSSGNCDGMSITSLRLFKEWEHPSDFQPGVLIAYNLENDYVRNYIHYFSGLQYVTEISKKLKDAQTQTVRDVFNNLRDSFVAGTSDTIGPYVVHITPSSHLGAHTLVPYLLEDKGGGEWWVWVYDSNHPYPTDSARHMVINVNSDTWSYFMGNGLGLGTWSGVNGSHTLQAIPLSVYYPVQTGKCPWCTSQTTSQIMYKGGGHLQFTDGQGRRLGYFGDQYVEEIPGGYGIPDFGYLGVGSEPTYYLPTSGTYQMTLDGSSLSQPSQTSVRQFGPGYAAGVDATLTTQSAGMGIADDGSTITYQPYGTSQVKFVLASDAIQTASYEFDVSLLMNASQIVRVHNNATTGKFTVQDGWGPSGSYDVKVARVDQWGEHTFTHASVSFAAGDTQYLDYANWNGSDAVTLLIDHGSNGTIDETLILNNQYSSNTIYLPLIVK